MTTITVLNNSVLIDGREVPEPDSITYNATTGITSLGYQGCPTFVGLAPGGGGRAGGVKNCGAAGGSGGAWGDVTMDVAERTEYPVGEYLPHGDYPKAPTLRIHQPARLWELDQYRSSATRETWVHRDGYTFELVFGRGEQLKTAELTAPAPEGMRPEKRWIFYDDHDKAGIAEKWLHHPDVAFNPAERIHK